MYHNSLMTVIKETANRWKKTATLITVTVNCELWLWIVTVNTWYETVNCELWLWVNCDCDCELWHCDCENLVLVLWPWISDCELWLWTSLWTVNCDCEPVNCECEPYSIDVCIIGQFQFLMIHQDINNNETKAPHRNKSKSTASKQNHPTHITNP